MLIRISTLLASLMLLLAAAQAAPADRSPDWAGIKGSTITLFYPGRSSWEFLLSDDHRLGARFIRQGRRDCAHCHLSRTGELDLLSDEIASGALRMKRSQIPFENEPLPRKKGVLHAEIKAAFDDEYLYIRVEWDSAGIGWGKETKANPAPPPDRVSFQLNAKGPAFEKYGCFITCHNDQKTMPLSPPPGEVKRHPYYGSKGREDVRLYASYTRRSGWKEMISREEMESALKLNGIIDLWTMELAGGKGSAKDGWIFEDRDWEGDPSIHGSGDWLGGRYTVVIKRRLDTGDPRDVRLKAGDTINMGIAIHDNRAEKRKHYVSFPVTLGIGTKAHVTAERVR